MGKKFVVYRSSAGSGKTTTLVKEYLKIALAGTDSSSFGKILAITFTNKAAAEMKERVIKYLRELSKPGTDDKLSFIINDLESNLNIDHDTIRRRSKKLLQAILHDYSSFSISTIDKFVHRIIRTFAYDLRLPLNFEVEMDGEKLLTQAVDLLIARIGSDELLTRVLVEYAESKSEDEKSWQIERDIVDFSKLLLQDEGQINLARLKHINLEQFIGIRNALQKFNYDFEAKLTGDATEAISIFKSAGVDSESFYYGTKGIGGYFSKVSRGDFSTLDAGYAKKTVEENKWYSPKCTAQQKVAIDSVSDALASKYNSIVTHAEKHVSEYTLFSSILSNIHALAVLNEVEKIVTEIKENGNIIHISEFNRLISAVVMQEPAPFIYERIGRRYRHFLVDEFQDTSVMQWLNILPLIDESLAEENFNMIVGDGKQAIYRWRGGEVEQFVNLPAIPRYPGIEDVLEPLIPHDMRDSDNLAAMLLSQREQSLKRHYAEEVLASNFRSKREIIEFNNDFFEHISHKLDEDYRRVYAALEQKFRPENIGGVVHIEFLENEEKASKKPLKETLDKIMQTIKQVVSDGYSLRDIAILTRTNPESGTIAKHLLENGIDVISSESMLISNSREVNFLVSIIRFLEDEKNLVAAAEMVCHLHSAGDYPDTKLHEMLRWLDPKGKHYAFRKFLRDHYPAFRMDELSVMPLYELVEKCLRIFVPLKPDPFIVYFLDAVHNFTNSKGSNRKDFLDWWEDKQHKLFIIAPDGIDAVKIMTIHKSKGLEFPVVIYPFATEKVKTEKNSMWLQVNNEIIPELPVALVKAGKTLEQTVYAADYAKETNKSILDSFNVIYVAFTRPVDRLYVLSQKPAKTSKSISLSSLLKEYLIAKGLWSDDQSSYTIGSALPQASTHSEPDSAFYLPTFISSDWNRKVQISKSSSELWADKDALQSSADYGILVHTALSRIKTQNDTTQALTGMVDEGLITEGEMEILAIKLNTLISLPELKPFFTLEEGVKNECDILLGDGSWRRPDRVVHRGNKITLLEYKTGAEHESHHRQVAEYETILREMGFSEVEKLLVYTSSGAVVKV